MPCSFKELPTSYQESRFRPQKHIHKLFTASSALIRAELPKNIEENARITRVIHNSGRLGRGAVNNFPFSVFRGASPSAERTGGARALLCIKELYPEFDFAAARRVR